MATRILRMNDDTQELGHKWVTEFRRDNPRVASVIGRPIEAARNNGTHPDAIQESCILYEDICRRYKILPANAWNMDEHGIALGVCTNSRVLASSSKRRSYIKSPESREWVLIIKVMSPLGRFTRPLVIFEGTAPQTSHFPTDTTDWCYTTSKNGQQTARKFFGFMTFLFLELGLKMVNSVFLLWMAMAAIQLLNSFGSASKIRHISYSFLLIHLMYSNHLIWVFLRRLNHVIVAR
jgi:hypothetical protein